MEKVSESSKENKRVYETIEDKLGKLSRFLDSALKSALEDAENVKKRALKADEEKDKAESERKDAQKERATAEKEKAKALEGAKQAHKALEKAEEEAKQEHRALRKAQEKLDAFNSDTESAWTQVRDHFSCKRK